MKISLFREGGPRWFRTEIMTHVRDKTTLEENQT